MSKDHLEHRYRKSPGRQYGYEYDPLRSQNEGSPSNSGTALAQRPDPRRTRQLMRQHIIASRRPLSDEMDSLAAEDLTLIENPQARVTRRFAESQRIQDHDEYNERFANSYPPQTPPLQRVRPARTPRLPATRELAGEEQDWHDDSNSESAYNEYSQHAEEEYEDERVRRPLPVARRSRRDVVPSRRVQRDPRTRVFVHEEKADENNYEAPADEQAPVKKKPAEGRIFEEHEELPPGLRPVKRPQNMSRRGWLIGIGAVGVVAAGVAVASNVPRITPPVQEVINNTGKTFEEGIEQGSDTVRDELVNAMYNVEGFTIETAIAAARLARSTYDVIVSPVIEFGSTLSEDFLVSMLEAMKSARGSLAQIYQDNVTLAAIQKVLESWVEQVDKLPKQLDLITQTDLDGAQAYLEALQRKLDEEKRKLTEDPQTPTATPQDGTPVQQETTVPPEA